MKLTRMKLTDRRMVRWMVLGAGLVGLPCGAAESSVAAFGEFLREPYFRKRGVEFAVLDYGLFPEVRARPSFGRLVAALSNECGGCFATWTAVGTNDFTRKVFRIALAESGPTVYTPFLTNLLLAVERNPTAEGVTEVERSIDPGCSKLEYYYTLNYAQPEVRDLWLRARKLFKADGRSDSVEWADEVLSGERRREYDECDFIDYGPSAVIRRPYKDGTW